MFNRMWKKCFYFHFVYCFENNLMQVCIKPFVIFLYIYLNYLNYLIKHANGYTATVTFDSLLSHTALLHSYIGVYHKFN